MTGSGLSVRAWHVVEHVRNAQLDPYTTSVSGVQTILDAASGMDGPVEVAGVIVEELDAAGYLGSRDGHRFTVLRESRGGRVEVAHAWLDELATQLAQVLSPGEDTADSLGGVVSVRPEDLGAIRHWADDHGIRAQTWLAIAWEHGWVRHAVRLAAALGQLWTLLEEWSNAASVLAVAQEAQSVAFHEHQTDLWVYRTRAFGDARSYDEAVQSATSAVLSALESRNRDRLAAAYCLRGDMHGRAGRLAESVRDLWIAERHARWAVLSAPLGDRSCVDVDPEHVAGHLAEAKARLEAAAVSSAWAWGPSAEAHGLLATADIANSLLVGHADAPGIYLARVVRQTVSALPDATAAQIATTLGKKAQTSGLRDIAVSYFDLAADRYDSVGRHGDAAATRTLRDRAMTHSTSGNAPDEASP